MAERPSIIVPGSEQIGPDGEIHAFHIMDPLHPTGEATWVINHQNHDGTTLYDNLGGAPGGVGAPPPPPDAAPEAPAPPPSGMPPPPEAAAPGPPSAPAPGPPSPGSPASGPSVGGVQVDTEGVPTAPTAPLRLNTESKGTNVTSKAMNPADRAALNQSTSNVQDAIVNKAKADQALVIEQGKSADLYAQHLAQVNADEQARQAAFNKAQEDRLKNLDQMTSDLSNSKIDTQHYWADKSTGDKVLAGISILLGGLGAGLAGGPNVGMDLIDKAITRDIEAQKANLENKRMATTAQRGLVGEYAQTFKNREEAANAAEITYWKQISAELDAKSTTAKTQQISAAAQEASGLAKQKVAELMAEHNGTSATSSTSAQDAPYIGKPPEALRTELDQSAAHIDALNRARAELAKGNGEGLGMGTDVKEGLSRASSQAYRDAVLNNKQTVEHAQEALRGSYGIRRPGQNADAVVEKLKVGTQFDKTDNLRALDAEIAAAQADHDRRARDFNSYGGVTPAPVPSQVPKGLSSFGGKKIK